MPAAPLTSTPTLPLLALLVAGLWLWAPVACSSTRPEHIWMDRYLVATSVQDERRWEEAMGHYDQLLKHASTPERRRMVRYRIATLYDDKGEQARALPLYKALMEEPVSDDWGARAMHRVYTLEGDAKLLPTLVLRYGNTTAAQHAIDQMRTRALGRHEVLPLLDQWATMQPEVTGDAQDYLLFWRAKVLRDEAGRGGEAVALWEQIVEHYGDQGLADDAMWEIARTFDAQKKWPQALAMYQRLVQEHQGTSWFMGDYNSEHADDARWRRAEIFLEQGKVSQAIDQWQRFLSEFPHNRMADDAAWKIVGLQATLDQDPRRHRGALERFIAAYPESRHVPAAQMLMRGQPVEAP